MWSKVDTKTVKKVPVLTVDLELLRPGKDCVKAIGACLTYEPGHVVAEQFKVVIETNKWKGQTCDEFWRAHPEMVVEVQKLPLGDQKVIFANCGFEYSCLKNFWFKHVQLLRELDKQAVPLSTALDQFIWFYQKVTSLAGNELRVATDNPACDIATLDHFLAKRNILPMSFRSSGVHRSIQDVKALIKGHMNSPHDRHIVSKFLKRYNLPKPTIDHDPLHDALHIAQLYGYFLTVAHYATK